jgi:hypothetical protein
MPLLSFRTKVRRAALIAALLASAAGAAHAQSAAPFALGEQSFVRGLFIDGDTLAIGGSTAQILTRDGRSQRLGQSSGTLALCGRRVGDRLVIAHAGYDAVTRVDGAVTARSAAPVLNGERLVHCAIDAAGAVYFVGERRAVYRWSGRDWSVLAFDGQTNAAAAAIAPDDTLYVLTQRGVLRRRGDVFELALSSTNMPDGESSGAWISERTLRMYIAWDNAVVVLDLRNGNASTHRHSMFGRTRAITGIAAPTGDLVAVAAQSNVALFDGATFSPLPQQYVFAGGLAFDPAGRALYVGAQSTSGAIAITGDRALARLTGAQVEPVQAQPVASDTSAARSAPDEAADARSAQRTEASSVAGQPPANEAPRREQYSYFPVARFGFGLAAGEGASRTHETGFAFDFNAGLFAYKERASVQFLPEIGVSYQAGPSPGGTYLTVGGSVLYGNMLFSGGLLARGMLGGSSSGFAGGVRTGLALQALFTSVTLDVGYQYLLTGGNNQHAFVGTISVNPMPLVGALFLATMFGRIFR